MMGWLKKAASEFSEHDVMSKAAALALYCALGLAPIVLLLLAVTEWLGPATQEAVVGQVESLVGGEAGKGVAEVVEQSRQQREEQRSSGLVPAIVGFVVVLFSASGIFAQLQTLLNDLWNLEPKPSSGGWSWLQSRLLSVGTLLSVLFLLLVSLVISAGISIVFGEGGQVWMLVSLLGSLMIYIILFAVIFKLLPDAELRWKDVFVNATVTAILFAVGKYLIGLYLGQSAMASSYGAAGSLVALIIWVYYSSIIVFLGAVITKLYAVAKGGGIRPDEPVELKKRQDAAG